MLQYWSAQGTQLSQDITENLEKYAYICHNHQKRSKAQPHRQRRVVTRLCEARNRDNYPFRFCKSPQRQDHLGSRQPGMVSPFEDAVDSRQSHFASDPGQCFAYELTGIDTKNGAPTMYRPC